MALRDDFPPEGSDYMGGECDGYEYKTIFAGASLDKSYAMVQQFLREEGYSDVPIPRDASELALFRLPTRNKQILLFEDNGYAHNPVKILFSSDGRRKNFLLFFFKN